MRLPVRRIAVLVAVALLAGALGIDLLASGRTGAVAATVAQAPATAGSWYCPVTAADDESVVLSIASAGDVESGVVVVRHVDGTPIAQPPGGVAPGDQLDVFLPPGEASAPVSVRWDGGPVVVTWRVEGEHTAAAPCAEAPSGTWYLPGLDTADGSRALLHLFNAFSTDAVASVSFATPGGPVTLVRTENVVVEAGRARVLDLTEFIPEEPDVAAVVRVRSGRLVAGAEVTYAPREGQTGPTGRTLVPAATAPAEELGVAFARVDDTATSSLSILNPGSEDASVEVVASDPAPDQLLFADLSVPAGGVRRVDLQGISAVEEFGVGVRSLNEVGVVVARTTVLRAGDREGITTALAMRPSAVSAIAGAGTAGRNARLVLYNPTGTAAAVAVGAGAGTPPSWSALEVGPNGRIALDLDEVGDDVPALALQVAAQAPVVAELRVFDRDGALDLWSATGVAAARWRGPRVRPVLRRDPALATRQIAPITAPTGAAQELTPVAPDPIASPVVSEPEAAGAATPPEVGPSEVEGSEVDGSEPADQG